MSDESSKPLSLPPNKQLPFFAYGAFKPGMPAYERIRECVGASPLPASVRGELFIRDGLPLLSLGDDGVTDGYLLYFEGTCCQSAYEVICEFEPSKHYQWQIADIGGMPANLLVGRYLSRGNPQPLMSSNWRLTDDPAFGEGLQTVGEVIRELSAHSEWSTWQKFFRAQMAYLLLWSILERLSQFCFGMSYGPTKRAELLASLRGMPELVARYVDRSDKVSDSRAPKTTLKLDAAHPSECFKYYYQIRSNLCHRGKAVSNEADKVRLSLVELYRITDGYLEELRRFEAASQ